MESDAIRRSATGPGVEDLPSASAPVPPGLRPVFEELFTWQNNMSSWAHDADEQEKLLSRLTDKVSGVNIDGSGDAGPSGYRETSSGAGSERAPSGHHEPVVTLAGISLMQRLLRTRLVRKSHDVEVQRKDPKSPLYSFKTFEGLSLRPELLKSVYACGCNEPSKIKETALPLLLADPPLNMIAQSQSGTGKTAAFVLASLSRVDEKQRYPQVLILSPTYDLAVHTGEVAKRMTTVYTITFCYAVLGVTLSRGEKIQDHAILRTPGKIVDWALKFNFFDLSRIKVFVLDEAYIMIAMHGHHCPVHTHPQAAFSNCQNMLFSATYDTHVMEFAEMIICNPEVIRLRKAEESVDNIKECYVVCSSKEEKFSAISNIYGVLAIKQTII